MVSILGNVIWVRSETDVSTISDPFVMVKFPILAKFAKISSTSISEAAIFRAISKSVATLEKFAPKVSQ